MKAKIHSIESFGTVDGPGTRFIVFLKGCPLRCKYCHNPDTWDMSSENIMSVDDIIARYKSVEKFVKSGITISGGEPLMQIDFIIELFKELKKDNIHTCIDTSGITFTESAKEKFDILLQYTDLFLLDIKHIDDEEHIKLTGVSNKNIFNFASYLSENDKPMWIRHVLVPGITLDDKLLYKLGLKLAEYKNIENIEVLPYHKMGISKYEQMEIKYPLGDLRAATKEEAKRAKQIILYAREQNAK